MSCTFFLSAISSCSRRTAAIQYLPLDASTLVIIDSLNSGPRNPVYAMKAMSQSASRGLLQSLEQARPRGALLLPRRNLHTTPSQDARISPITAAGPPPKPPVPSTEHIDIRVARKKKQSELLKRGQDLRASHMKPGTSASKRFWKDVHVRDGTGELQSPPFT